MEKIKRRYWTDADDQYIKENIGLGLAVLQAHFGVTYSSMRKRCQAKGVSINQYKKDNPKKTFHKADNNEKFTDEKHIIINSSVEGKTAVFIKSKNMTIFVSAGRDIDATVERYTREKSFV